MTSLQYIGVKFLFVKANPLYSRNLTMKVTTQPDQKRLFFFYSKKHKRLKQWITIHTHFISHQKNDHNFCSSTPPQINAAYLLKRRKNSITSFLLINLC